MSKKLLLIFLFSPLFAWGQTNLVFNPSFEDTILCPTGPDEVSSSNGWNSYSLSPDYFNNCSANLDVSVPYNWGGYQQPASGNAYCAFGSYSSQIYGNNIREFIGGQLTLPLLISTKYFVSFKVNLSLDDTIEANCASDHMGAMFSTVPYTWNNPAPITNNPPIYSSMIITDTTNWTRIFGSFIADSAYQYIIIGTFFDDLNIDTLIMDSDTLCRFSYYYVDDVCVSTDSLYAATWTGIQNSPQNPEIQIYPNPIHDYFIIEGISSYQLKIMNTIGQLLYEENINEPHKKIFLNNINSQVLLIQIISQNQLFTYKLLKP